MKLYKKFTSREGEAQQTMSAGRDGDGLRLWSIITIMVVIEAAVVVLSTRYALTLL